MGRLAWSAWTVGLLAWAGSGPVWAGGLAPGMEGTEAGVPSNPVHAWKAVSEDRLDDMRGGFDIPNVDNLRISFGIDRAVYVNGALTTSVSVNIPDVARMTVDQARQLAAVANTVNLVQNGPNNAFSPDTVAGATAAATVIQNTLNNQTLQSLTTINAAVNSLPQFRQLNLGNLLQNALANVVNLH
ncbi:hypothetical protein LBW59_01020 [Ralstonia solanacearum]|uniref:Lipoprotein n=1 Tax=Ralstonia solanacearum TaxID=305 RepID=A0AAW5ZJF1_RALSL|nr:hypothetical protein [Ralstonia solanacearum]AST31121.2 hypothetical protein CDC46_02300 [Ralstonia solanacearum]AYB52555.2 hypothetical protein C2I38_14460 [Ralstonia solanacearum]AYB57122.1 hypothetical protein C2L97_14450 [Ralstonia solanacearum]MDB0508590.1 hypothetical protein [Ralstonia solanacearum]MDB0513855.1 hypothetical protein [Ralstonia solanacearum]